ncbi:unnamed protein product, partial [Discosporangium mesarthrocarpum]
MTNFVEHSRLVEYTAGEPIFLEGEQGDNLYVIQDGIVQCSERSPEGTEIPLYTMAAGQCFGVDALMFRMARDTTMLAKTKVKCWVVDVETFERHVLKSTRVKQLFNKYATVEDHTEKERLMTMEDFAKSCLEGDSLSTELKRTKEHRLQSLFHLLRGGRDVITFRDFVLFNILMARPDPEYDIAFILMDSSRRGYVILDDVKAFLSNNQRMESFEFNFDCDLMKRFFGEEGKNRLR